MIIIELSFNLPRIRRKNIKITKPLTYLLHFPILVRLAFPSLFDIFHFLILKTIGVDISWICLP